MKKVLSIILIILIIFILTGCNEEKINSENFKNYNIILSNVYNCIKFNKRC